MEAGADRSDLPKPRPRRGRPIGAGTAVLVLVAGVTAWIDRRGIVGGVVDRKLAAAGVAGRYRIEAFSPSLQVIEDVALGDRAEPDLVARRVVLEWRYRFGLPVLRSVRAEGVRARGRWQDGRLTLGSLDRLLPRNREGGAGLPDLELDLADARARVSTVAGTVDLAIDGRGNLRHDFAGELRVGARALALSGCGMDDVRGRTAVHATPEGLGLRGELRTGIVACAGANALLEPSSVAIALHLAPTLDAAIGRIAPRRITGRIGGVRFGELRGAIDVHAAHGRAEGRVDLAVARAAGAGFLARRAALEGSYRLGSGIATFDGQTAIGSAGVTSGVPASLPRGGGTPLEPILRRVNVALADMAQDTAIDARLSYRGGARTAVSIENGRWRSRAGRTARFSARYEVAAAGAWRLDATSAAAGLPSLRLALAGVRGGTTQGVAWLGRYAMPGASFAATPVRFTGAGGRFHADTSVTLTGPLAGGRIEGLSVPLTLDRDGNGVTINQGCRNLTFESLALAGMRFGRERVLLCGAPMLRAEARGTRIDLRAADLRWQGRSGTAPLALALRRLRVSEDGFVASGLVATLGSLTEPTRLAISRLDGSFDASGLNGVFAGAKGAIARVPLGLDGANGTWRLAGGTLALAGALRVSDSGAVPPRFNPLPAREVRLALHDGRIAAQGRLTTPDGTATVAQVTLAHDLSSGRGDALLSVPGITFARRGLQPEVLTPLTLGVVASVAGRVSGEGRIGWSPVGTTSNGRFTTDALDLAAAFGPVKGIAGTIVFTDLLGLVTATGQRLHIATVNPGVAVEDGIVRYRLLGPDRVAIEEGVWPFAGGTLRLEPTTLPFASGTERRMTFAVSGVDAAAFVQHLEFPNIAATGTFDGRLPMVFDAAGGRIEGGQLGSRGAGTLAYVGEISNANLGTLGHLAFDALKAIRYRKLDVAVDGRLDGEMVTLVRFDGVRQPIAATGIVSRLIRNLPFRFNIAIRAPFRALIGTTRTYADPSLLLREVQRVQPADSVGQR